MYKLKNKMALKRKGIWKRSVSLKSARQTLGALGLASLSFVCIASDLGNYDGNPARTWTSLEIAGLKARTFSQPNLLQAGEAVQRRYLQYVPSYILKQSRSQPGSKYPLVIALHGANQSAELFRDNDLGDQLERLADREGFMVIYANAYVANGSPSQQNPGNPLWANTGYWRGCTGHQGDNDGFFNVDDTDYLRRIIAQVQRERLPVDLNRIYLMGSSNGGEMVQRAAREMPTELAGVGVVIPVNTDPATHDFLFCVKAEQKPVSMMFIYSPGDPWLSWIYASLGFNYGNAMADSVGRWRDAMGINPRTERVTQLPNLVNEGEGYGGALPWALATMNSTITRYDYGVGKHGANFSVLQMNIAAGHGWPRMAKPTSLDSVANSQMGFINSDINAEEVLWDFLKTQTRSSR